MLLICEDHNENARFTRGTRSRIYFPGSSNNSLWACLCSDFNLWALRSCWRTLMFCLNELTVLLDTSPSSQPTPPTNSVTCDKHHVSSAAPNSGSHARIYIFFFPSFNFVNDWKKNRTVVSRRALSEQRPLWCVRLYVSKQRCTGCFLLPYSPATSSRWAFMSDAPSGHGVC